MGRTNHTLPTECSNIATGPQRPPGVHFAGVHSGGSAGGPFGGLCLPQGEDHQ